MPFGVRVIGILAIIGGIFGILWGLAMTGLGGASWLTGLLFSQGLQSWGGAAFGGGLWIMVVGIVQIVTGFGLFARQQWAWLLALISAGLSLVGPVMGLLSGHLFSIFGLIIPGIIFYYLFANDDVKRAFGRLPTSLSSDN